MPFVKPEVRDASDAQDDGQMGELGDVLQLFPEGRTAVRTMNEKILSEGILDPAVRALVAAVAAQEWSDPVQFEQYLSAHATARGIDIEAARESLAQPDFSGIEANERTLATYVIKAATEAFKMVQRDVDAVAAAGWSERETVEALTVVCVVAYNAVANLALGITEGMN